MSSSVYRVGHELMIIVLSNLNRFTHFYWKTTRWICSKLVIKNHTTSLYKCCHTALWNISVRSNAEPCIGVFFVRRKVVKCYRIPTTYTKPYWKRTGKCFGTVGRPSLNHQCPVLRWTCLWMIMLLLINVQTISRIYILVISNPGLTHYVINLPIQRLHGWLPIS